jgi:thiol-disulfide isomerase/thioredoxin
LGLLLSPLVVGSLSCSKPGVDPERAAPPALRRLPAFDYTLLDGQRLNSQALAGRVILINFWATTCAVCVAEMPHLVALHNRLQPLGLHTLAVAVRHDPPALVSNFAQSRQLPFGVAIDNLGEIAKSFVDVRATPTTYVVSRQGLIEWRVEGRPDFDKLQALLQRLLNQA